MRHRSAKGYRRATSKGAVSLKGFDATITRKHVNPDRSSSSVLVVLAGMLIVVDSGLVAGWASAIAVLLLLIPVRVYLHRLADQQRARILFGRVLAMCFLVGWVAALAMCHSLHPLEPISAGAVDPSMVCAVRRRCLRACSASISAAASAIALLKTSLASRPLGACCGHTFMW